jgi:hypothetical protein
MRSKEPVTGGRMISALASCESTLVRAYFGCAAHCGMVGRMACCKLKTRPLRIKRRSSGVTWGQDRVP